MTTPSSPNGTPSDSERPTLKTIAIETGLAIATVSRALKNAPDIGEETKRRVRETAERLGYRPNRAGVRLRTGKTNVIALVLSAESNVMNFTSQLMYSIAKALRGTPYHMVVMPFFLDQDPMDPIRYLVETESADGIIINQTQPDDPRVAYMAQHGFPFATHGRTAMGLDHAYFDFDNEAYGRLAVEELAKRGRRHLYVIAPPATHTYSHHMVNGARLAAAGLGMRVEVAQDINSDFPVDVIEAGVAARFAGADRPDALLSGSTNGAMAAVTAVEALGMKLNRDIDVVAKEAIPYLHRFRPEMIVVREDVARAGESLAHAVMAAIEGRKADEGQFLEVPTEAITCT